MYHQQFQHGIKQKFLLAFLFISKVLLHSYMFYENIVQSQFYRYRQKNPKPVIFKYFNPAQNTDTLLSDYFMIKIYTFIVELALILLKFLITSGLALSSVLFFPMFIRYVQTQAFVTIYQVTNCTLRTQQKDFFLLSS